jgi:glycyl-tRNA synthetase beta chain
LPSNEFFLEIGTEEIPDWMIEPALKELQNLLWGDLLLRSLVQEDGLAEVHATPRRLVLYIPAVLDKQPDIEKLVTGPPKSAPQRAAESFAQKMGVPLSQIEVVSTPKGEYWGFRQKQKGLQTKELLKTLVPDTVLRIHFPKTMYWTGKNGPRFIRPIRSLLALYGRRVVPFSIAGVKSAAYTFGHRVLGKPRIKVTGFQQFLEELKNNGVVLKADERREKILAEAARLLAAAQPEGSPRRPTLRENPTLLNTLVYLTEFPTADMGQFDPAYLELPEEVLVTVMQHHQKYLSVSDAAGKLAPRFIFVMNLDGDSTGAIRHGNERVLRARFNDARFFWETDQKTPLCERLPMLEHVTFQSQLGSYRQKTERNVALVRRLAAFVPQAPVEHAARAAELAKCDLTTELVKEFTELQGVVGGLYARAQGEPGEVADAIYDHYKPESMEERSPRTPAGALVALADKLDTLAGCFSIGLKPSGSSDPFALRRAAQGVVKILADHNLHAPLPELIAAAQPSGEAAGQLLEFFLDRLRYYLREVRGFRYDEVNAVLAVGAQDVPDAIARCEAVRQVRPTSNFEPLSAAFKRIQNILRKAGGVGQFPGEPDAALLEGGAEAELDGQARRVFEETKESRDYEMVLRRTAELRPAVDTFFDKVLVMAEDERVRRNRLTFLAWLLRAFTRVADFSEIVVS